MSHDSFTAYARSESLSDDEIYTVELLIERVRDEFDPDAWENFSERSDARESPGYQPYFSPEHVPLAEPELGRVTWLSFQRLRDTARPVRDIEAVRFLPELTGLILQNNEIADLGPVSSLKNLRRLNLLHNPIRDLSPIAACRDLTWLELDKTPIEDLSVLELLPALNELSISIDQLPVFKLLECLPSVEKLEFDLETFDSFEGFPEMPKLRIIRGAHVNSLAGLERFPNLQNLVNLSGTFGSLEPLRDSRMLTHANILDSRIDSLEPLSGLFALRDLWLNTEKANLDLSPLEGLPSLHRVNVSCAEKPPPALSRLRSELSSWDVEFRADKPEYTPSLEIEVVDQETFNRYDFREPYGLTDADKNEGLLSSELVWLDAQIEQVLEVDFEENEDFYIPFQWNEARSRTVVLVSEEAVEAFPRLALGIQDILCRAKNDWIIYFQSDGDEFIVWLYPDRIVTTAEYADSVRRLVRPN